MSNNGWLQEMPKPQNKMTWDNAVWISPKSAAHYGVATGDIVTMEYRGRKVDGPVWILPGHADESVTIQFGYGRTRAGKVGNDIGFNAYALRSSDALWHGAGVSHHAEVERLSLRHHATHPDHGGARSVPRGHVRRVSPATGIRAIPEDQRVADDHTLFPLWDYSKGYKWGMSIDLTACVGCQACMVACQAENNIPVVGKDEVAKGRHMHWIRVDRYYKGGARRSRDVFPAGAVHAL